MNKHQSLMEYRKVCIAALTERYSVTENQALAIMQGLIFHSPEDSLDFELYTGTATSLIEFCHNYAADYPDMLNTVTQLIKEFVCERAEQRFNLNFSSQKEDDGDILSQLRSLGFGFEEDAAVEIESPTQEHVDKIMNATNALRDKIIDTVQDNIGLHGASMLQVGPDEIAKQIGLDPRNPVYAKFTIQFVRDVIQKGIDDSDIGEAYLAFLVCAFIEAMESGQPCDKHFESLPKDLDSVFKYSLRIVNTHWRKTPLMVAIIDTLSTVFKAIPDDMKSGSRFIETIGTMAKIAVESDNILPMNPENEFGLDTIHQLMTAV